MSNKTFNTLRFIQSMIVPLASFISILSERWGFAYGVEIAFALTAFNTLFGIMVENWRKAYNNENKEAEQNGGR
ncbi:MAG: hypothetical protein IKU26_03135 [Clostridia bacterium]|nr:hypothetical protein [Clostridia bacterium]